MNPNDSDFVACLFDLDLEVREGELLGVAGPVGSGKSSLVSAIMGEMKNMGGEVRARGRMALVSQQAWIFSGTLRENILFGTPFNRERYSKRVQTMVLKNKKKFSSFCSTSKLLWRQKQANKSFERPLF